MNNFRLLAVETMKGSRMCTNLSETGKFPPVQSQSPQGTLKSVLQQIFELFKCSNTCFPNINIRIHICAIFKFEYYSNI